MSSVATPEANPFIEDEEDGFECTSSKTTHERWYKVEGVPALEGGLNGIAPMVVRFTFIDGVDPATMFINGKLVKKNGEISERWQQVMGVYLWDQRNWPEWLKKVLNQAVADYKHDRLNNRA